MTPIPREEVLSIAFIYYVLRKCGKNGYKQQWNPAFVSILPLDSITYTYESDGMQNKKKRGSYFAHAPSFNPPTAGKALPFFQV